VTGGVLGRVSGAAEFRLVALPADDFPALPRFEKVLFVNVDPKWLLEMIDLTSFSVSSDETRYNLNGVFFEPSAGTLRTVATDGHRLSRGPRRRRPATARTAPARPVQPGQA